MNSSKNYKKISQVTLRNLLILQTFFTLSLSLGFYVYQGMLAGVSSVLGGIISIVPGLLFAGFFFKLRGARAAKRMVQAFYLGETYKWLFTFFLFVLTFQWKDVQPIPLFLVFIATQLVYWLILLIKPRA